MLADRGERLLLSIAELSQLQVCLCQRALLCQICNGEPMPKAKALGDHLQAPQHLSATDLCSLQCGYTRTIRDEVRNSF